jgi:hypothetical protein
MHVQKARARPCTVRSTLIREIPAKEWEWRFEWTEYRGTAQMEQPTIL